MFVPLTSLILRVHSKLIDGVANLSEFTQRDGRKKRTAKRSCVKNMTELLHACFVVILT